MGKAWNAPLSIFIAAAHQKLFEASVCIFSLICRRTTFSWEIHPSSVKRSKWKTQRSQAVVSCVLLIPEFHGSHFYTFTQPLTLCPCIHAAMCHVTLSLAHKAVKDWLSQDGRLRSKGLLVTFFQLSSPSSWSRQLLWALPTPIWYGQES